MAFDKTLPANRTKIRNYPNILTGNFAGIQTGDSTFKVWQLNFADRDLVDGAPPPAQDPVSIADTMIVYSKQNGDGETDLFIRDDRGSPNTVELTTNGSLGGPSTPVQALTISFDGGTFTNNQNAMCTAWASVVVSGMSISSQTGYGITFSRNGTGEYTGTFTASQVTNANYAVVGTAYSSSGGGEFTVLSIDASTTPTTTSFDIVIRKDGNSSRDRSFMIAVFGGR